jgi:hypothetical protein
MAKTVFIIYGRDSDAHDELVKFIRAVGLDELPFEAVADGLGPNPFIADVVITGIQKADAVIALFTPDEQAVLYDPQSGRSLSREERGSRWQARPNVMFEAGVAFGHSKREPILTVLGADVSLFSDVAGKHFIRLEASKAKRQLFNRLNAIVGPLAPTATDWETSTASGDFARCVRRRWQHFDEIEDLERFLSNRHIANRPPLTVLDIITCVVLADDKEWSRLDARTFLKAVKAQYGETRADDAYWWMIAYGFLQFDNIEDWGTVDDATWDDSVDNARFAARGLALIDRVRTLARYRRPDVALQPTSRGSRENHTELTRGRAARR